MSTQAIIFELGCELDIHIKNRALNFGEFKDGKLQQPLPPALEPHEGDIQHFTNLCNKTAARVMRLLALGLEVIPSFPSNQQISIYMNVKMYIDRPRVLRNPPRRLPRLNRLHPPVPVLPFHQLAGLLQLPT